MRGRGLGVDHLGTRGTHAMPHLLPGPKRRVTLLRHTLSWRISAQPLAGRNLSWLDASEACKALVRPLRRMKGHICDHETLLECCL